LTPLGDEPTRRLFFALWPDGAARSLLHEATAEFVSDGGAKPVPQSNLHVTLAFLGAVPVTRVAELGAVARVCAACRAWPLPFELTLGELAHWRKAQVLVVLGTHSSAIAALAEALQSGCARQGFTPDLKPFRAHVTVARKVLRPPVTPALRPIAWAFDEFALIESRSAPDGPIYSVVETFALVKPQKLHE
jgi:RNA 2',3'-cyclic 3'-phosphodiesterase